MMDINGMLDTARFTVWADISAKTPPSEDDTEIILLRKARLWHDSTGFTEPTNPNPEIRAKALEKQHPFDF